MSADTHEKTAKGWVAEIEDAKAAKRDFEERFKLASQDYEAERIATATGVYAGEYPIHWSNVRTIRPNLFFRRPPARVVREHKSRTDPTHILAAQILEASIEKTLTSQPVDAKIRLLTTYALNSGLGQVWLRYDYKEKQTEKGYSDIADEIVHVDVVHPDDFLMSRARHYDEVLWVARAIHFTRDEIKEKFGLKSEEIKKLAFGSSSSSDRGKDADELSNFARTRVWEIWSLPDEKQIFVADGYDKRTLLERRPEIKDKDKKLMFRGFFPCPRPLVLGSESLQSVYPICDHHYYSTQSALLNDLQDKSREIISKGLKVSGIYDSAAVKDVYSLLTSKNGDYVPGDFDETNSVGGWDAVVKMFPAEKYAQVLQMMDGATREQQSRIYEVSGMSDILRGQGDPRESATAQDIKMQSASMRLNELRLKVSAFVAEVYQMIGEVCASCYNWRTLLSHSGHSHQFLTDGDDDTPMIDEEQFRQVPPEHQERIFTDLVKIIEALRLLRDEQQRFFAVEVDSEDMLKRDEESEKRAAFEFADSLAKIISQFSQVSQTVPSLLMLMPDIVMLVVRKYDKGRSLEQKIEDLINKFVAERLEQQAQPKEDKPDPYVQIEQMKVQSNQQLEQLKLQLEQAFRQRDADREDFLAQLKAQELELKAQEAGSKIEIETAKLYQSSQTDKAKQDLEAAGVLIKDRALQHQEYKDDVELATTGVMR